MTATQKTKITGLGYDEAFGGIDLSGCPSIRPLPTDSSWIDVRFAPLQVNEGNALKKFIAEQTAEHTPPTTVHANGNEFRVFYRDNAWHADGEVAGSRRRYSDRDRDMLLSKLAQITKPQNEFRSLTESEKLQVIRFAQSGDKLTAIGMFLKFTIGEKRASQYDSPLDMLADPTLMPVLNQCAEYVWFHSKPHALDTPEWHSFKNRTLAGRPANFEILDAIWLQYQNHLEEQNTQSQLRPPTDDEPEETPREALDKLNALDDSEVDDLMHSTRQQFAREVRAGRR